MAADVGNGVAARRVRIENALHEVLALARDEARDVIVRVEDFFVQLCGVRVLSEKRMSRAYAYLEGQVAADHREEDDAAAPDVDVKSLVALACDHLGGCVAGRATSRFERFSTLVGVAQAEVDQFDALVLVEQQVLRLQVTVRISVQRRLTGARCATCGCTLRPR